MALWDIGFRHIVDVDGQLLAIDANLIDPATLLAKANRPSDRQLWLVRAGERLPIQARQTIRLPEDEVLFFESAETRSAWKPVQLAA